MLPISVVISLYNKERDIARAIQSVLNQTDRDFELIVVDDGSTDASVSVVKSVQDVRIRLIEQENGGECAARNRGIAESRAELAAFLDADDEWLPEHLATILRLAEKYPECGAYATAYYVVDRKRQRRTPKHGGIPRPPWEGIIPNYFRSAASCPVWSSAVAVPKRVFDAVGFFAVGVRHGGDLDMWCRIALRFPIAFSTQVSATFHQDAGNRMTMQELALGRQHLESGLFSTIGDALRAGILPPGVTRTDLVEYRNRKLIESACLHVVSGQAEKARKILKEAATTRVHRSWWTKWYLLSYVPYPLFRVMGDAKLLLRRTVSLS